MTEEKIRVLIADDDFAVRESMVELLEDFGHEAVGVKSTSNALEALNEATFDLAIVDVHLPEIGGERLICQASTEHPELKFMIHTGSSDLELPHSLIALGVTKDDLIFKPIRDIDEFVQRVVDKARS